jgi:hypothetical protein
MLKDRVMPGWQRARKAAHAEPTLRPEAAGAAKHSGVVRPFARIMEPDNTMSAPEPKWALERCRTIDPNHNQAPLDRVRSPRTAVNRRPSEWADCSFVLPKLTIEGLRQVAITLAQEGQHSPWPRERRRYARTKSHLVGEALDDFFRKLGFPEFCLQQEQQR